MLVCWLTATLWCSSRRREVHRGLQTAHEDPHWLGSEQGAGLWAKYKWSYPGSWREHPMAVSTFWNSKGAAFPSSYFVAVLIKFNRFNLFLCLLRPGTLNPIRALLAFYYATLISKRSFLHVWDSSYHGVQTSLKLRAFSSAGVTGMHHPVPLTNILYCLFLIVYGGKLCISVPLGGAVHECATEGGGELCISVPQYTCRGQMMIVTAGC